MAEVEFFGHLSLALALLSCILTVVYLGVGVFADVSELYSLARDLEKLVGELETKKKDRPLDRSDMSALEVRVKAFLLLNKKNWITRIALPQRWIGSILKRADFVLGVSYYL